MSQSREEMAWEKTSKKECESNSGRLYALSPEGAWVCWEDYNKEESIHGWNIDHWDGNPNNNNPDNLRAMQWENNRSKGNQTECYIRKVCADTSNEQNFKNIKKDTKMCLTNSPNKDE